jgi:hypothetical protein
MGKHYIPRYYLKGFSTSDDRNKIVAYDCSLSKNYLTNIINIAQEKYFYPKNTEKYLSDEIEEPANKILDKIKKRENLSYQDRKIFADYLVVIIKRVPSFINLIRSKFPESVDKIINRTKKKVFRSIP